jgi:hypothetical protein
MVETSSPAVGVVVEAPGGGSGQKRAPESRVCVALPERGPSHHHTPLRIVGGQRANRARISVLGSCGVLTRV